jgi:acyl-CoA synthetase (AMP-forming)/AMP-acid ligase II/acyl carrier protein
LLRFAAEFPERLAFGYLRDGETLTAQVTYGELARRAEQAAAALLRVAAPGDRILLTLKPGPAFAVALFGCWRAGMVPVPAYPPRPNRPNDRAFSIAQDAGARLAMVLDVPREDTRQALEAGNIECIDIGSLPDGTPPPEYAWPDAALHLLQYTSGSTSEPKGVGVSAAALAANLDAINQRLHGEWAGVTVSWLPHFHDFGLIEATIQTVWRGDTAYLISPTEFVKQPITWLKAMSRFRATETQAPNFAFDLLVSSIAPAAIAGLDLSSLKTVIVGAEPIRQPVMAAFLRLVQPLGFNPAALVHGYGMAETTLGASADPGPPTYREVDAAALERGQAQPAAPGASGRAVACCGLPLPGFDVVIADPQNRAQLGPDRVGEIWCAGPSLAMGYWQKPEITSEIFAAHTAEGAGPFLRTGDLGFLDDAGRLYVTGRLKDLLIVNGRNHYPQDLEATAKTAGPHLAGGRGAAFTAEGEGRETTILVQEVRRDAQLVPDDVILTLRRAIAAEHGVELDAVILVRMGTLPVTSSGKIQRRATRQAWQDGSLVVIATWQREGQADAQEKTPDQGLIQRLVAFAAELSGLPAASIDPAEPLSHLGLGSIEATRLTGLMESAFGLSIDPTAPYTHPTIEQLAQLVMERSRQVASDAIATVVASLPSAKMLQPAVAEPTAPVDPGIAIVGMACRFPGAPDIEAFWQLIRDGGRATGPLPAGRHDLAAPWRVSAAGRWFRSRLLQNGAGGSRIA